MNRQKLTDIIAKSLSENELLSCDKDWSAWAYGTMRDENFHDAGADANIVENIVNTIIKEQEDYEKYPLAD